MLVSRVKKASANHQIVSDTEETQKTVLEMEMNANYSNSDPFENGRLFCVSEDIETLDAEVYFQMDGERGIVEIKIEMQMKFYGAIHGMKK